MKKERTDSLEYIAKKHKQEQEEYLKRPIAKKNPIVKVTFSYVGKASDFETFLKTIVRDYLSADDPAAVPNQCGFEGPDV